ncbi:MAG: carotenoid 1,2-hydratase [Alphaproteobacteria bacterium]|nr:carotenoid 1,2-hydratase [Alphaproteobacteria bacterium]
MIGFVGSVFSPYYAFARRLGITDPENFCAINVGLYGERGHRWTMTERGKKSLHRTSTQFNVGPSSMAWEKDCLVIRIDEITVPFPSRIKGEIRLYPTIYSDYHAHLDPKGEHHWRPVAPLARVEAKFEKPNLKWRGTGYHDMNWGSVPLEDSFSSWFWSRTATQKGAHIVYDRTLRDKSAAGFALEIDRSGQATEIALPKPIELGTTFWQMRRPARADHPAIVEATLEDSPFYTRSHVKTVIDREAVDVFHESLSLDRFRNPIIQTMLPFKMPRRT